MDEQRQPNNYRIGIICALTIEKAAVEAVLDEKHESLPSVPGDKNDYSFGRIGVHNVVIACLPAGAIGKVSAASVARDMMRTFPIQFGLMVGIGGGVWSEKTDVRLGDVVVGYPNELHGGVIQWDFGKMEKGGVFRRTGFLNKPPSILLHAVQALKIKHLRGETSLTTHLEQLCERHPQAFSHPGNQHDFLFRAYYHHDSGITCDRCDKSKLLNRFPPRGNNSPEIHYGTIASGDQVMKDGPTRDRIARRENVICFEMEAAGLIDDLPCIVIRGICDYADSHKNKRWQPYAAAVAAAYAKDLLLVIRGQDDPKHEFGNSAINTTFPWYNGLYPASYIPRSGILSQIHIFYSSENLNRDTRLVLLHGLPGSGKTQIARAVAREKNLQGRATYWMDASSVEKLNNSFLNFARQARLESEYRLAKMDTTELQDLVVNFLANFDQPWLLIFDNYDFVDAAGGYSMTKYIPAISLGDIIITSRNGRADQFIGHSCFKITVAEMSNEEASSLLIQQAGLGQSSLDEVEVGLVHQIACDLMSGLPLAVAQAGAFIRNMQKDGSQTSQKLNEYIHRYSLHKELVLRTPSAFIVPEYERSVVVTFDMAFEIIKRKAPAAANLLLLCGFWHYNDIHVSWFEKVSSVRDRLLTKNNVDMSSKSYSWLGDLLSISSQGSWLMYPLMDALALLADYSLIRRYSNNELWEVHPLIHTWSVIYQRYSHDYDLSSQAKVAAALMTETYDKAKDFDGSIEEKVGLEMYSHVDSWIRVVDTNTSLLQRSSTPELKGHTIRQLARFLDSSALSPHHRSVETFVRLQILVLSNESVLNELDNINALESLRCISMWLAENFRFTKEEISATIVVFDDLIESAAAKDPIDVNAVLSRAYNKLTKSICFEKVLAKQDSIYAAEEGLRFVEENGYQCSDHKRIRLTSLFLAMICRLAPNQAQQMDITRQFEDVLDEAEALLGTEHFVTLETKAFYNIFASRNPFEIDNNVSDRSDLSGGDRDLDLGQSPPLTLMWLAGEVMMEMRRNGMHTPRLMNLLRSKYELEIERYGLYHDDTLSTELQILDQIGYRRSGSKLSDCSFLTIDRWPTRESVLIQAIEVAIALDFHRENERLDNFWSGFIAHMQVAGTLRQRMTECMSAFEDAVGAAQRQKMDKQATLLEQVSDRLKIEYQTRFLRRGEALHESASRLSTLWTTLKQLQGAAEDSNEKLLHEVQQSFITQLRTAPPATREALLCMVIKYLTSMLYREPAIMISPLSSATTRVLLILITKSFGENGSMLLRWKVIEAVIYRMMDHQAHAVSAENYLLERSELEISIYAGISLYLQSLAGEPDQVQNERASENPYATTSLERVMALYRSRGWHSAVLRIYEEVVSMRGTSLGFASPLTIGVIAVAGESCEKMDDWRRLRELLDRSKAAILGERKVYNSQMGDFASQLLTQGTKALASDGCHRAALCMVEWLQDVFLNIECPETGEERTMILLIKMGIASQARLCYGSLGFDFNVQHYAQQMVTLVNTVRAAFPSMSFEERVVCERAIEADREFFATSQPFGQHHD